MRRRYCRVSLLLASLGVASALLLGMVGVISSVLQRGETAHAAQSTTISLKEAADRVRAFTSNRGLELQGDLDPFSVEAARPVYWLESGAGETTDEFRVDARTGEILEAVFRSRLIHERAERPASIEDAALIAARFGTERFNGFGTLSLLERSELPTAIGGSIFTLKWVLMEPTTNAELPTSVMVSVASANRAVVRYLAQRDPLLVGTVPEISPEHAVSVAQASIARAPAWSDAVHVSTRLQVVYDGNNRQRLAWALLYTSPRTALAPPRLLMLVDAHTGTVIETRG